MALESEQAQLSRYVELTRSEWARLRESTPLPLSEAQLRPLGGLTERVSLDEVISRAPANRYLDADEALELGLVAAVI